MKKIINSFGVLGLALVLVGLVYGGLNIYNLKQENAKLSTQFTSINDKINELQSKLTETQTAFDKTNTDNQEKLTDLQKKVVYYQGLALAPKEVLGTQTQVETAPVEVKPAVVETKTIIKTVEAPVKKQASVIVSGLGSYKVDVKSGDNAFLLLKRAATKNGFTIKYDTYSFGVFVTEIGGIKPSATQYWAFYYNGQFSNVGASDQKISTNDTTFWKLESF